MKNLPERKNIRLRNYNYASDGYYFVTICCYESRPNIGKYRNVVEKLLNTLPERFSGLSIDYCVLMPPHLHIIFIFENAKVELGRVVRTFKALVSKETNEKQFWQRNYYEHIIRNNNALRAIREYIQNNPAAERIKFEEFYKIGLDKSSPYTDRA